MIYLITALVIFLGYGIACSIYTGRIIKSWSDTFFSVSPTLFVLVLMSTAVLTFIGYQSWFVLTSAMLLAATASAPYFKHKNKIEQVIHYLGATGAMIFGFIEIIHALGLTGIILTSITGLVIFGLGKTKLRCKLALIEGLGFTVIILTLIIIL